VSAVVGVIAVWLSQDEHAARLQVPGKVAANVKAMVKEFSYPRIKRGPPVIWNGIDPRGLAYESPRKPATPGRAADSKSDVKGNIEKWCLDRCAGKCGSVFIYRILQFKNGKYKEGYFCTTYHSKWSNDLVQPGVLVADAGAAFNKISP
ncbi:hypothetical protein CSHISOI_08756, partial [Colletotrichum shisoi]